MDRRRRSKITKRRHFLNFNAMGLNVKFSTDQSALLTALDAVRAMAMAKSTIPILSNVLIDVTPSGLHITATNLDIEARTSIVADVGSTGKLTVPANMLADIVKRMAKGAVIHIEAIEDGNRLQIKSGRAKFHLGCLPASDWPDAKKTTGGQSFQIDPAILATALAKTKFAISTEETRYYLNGVYVHCAGELLTFVSTDGHRLAKYEVAAPEAIPGVIIPSLACAEFFKLASSAKEPLTMEVSPSLVCLSDGVTTIKSKTIDGSFPDYMRVVPKHNGRIAVADRLAWAAGASRVATVATDRGRAVKCVFRPDALDLYVSSTDGGDAFDSIDADFSGDAIEIGFNARYLADALAAFDGDTVSAALGDGVSPALLTSPGNPEMLIVLMPMRVS